MIHQRRKSFVANQNSLNVDPRKINRRTIDVKRKNCACMYDVWDRGYEYDSIILEDEEMYRYAEMGLLEEEAASNSTMMEENEVNRK